MRTRNLSLIFKFSSIFILAVFHFELAQAQAPIEINQSQVYTDECFFTGKLNFLCPSAQKFCYLNAHFDAELLCQEQYGMHTAQTYKVEGMDTAREFERDGVISYSCQVSKIQAICVNRPDPLRL